MNSKIEWKFKTPAQENIMIHSTLSSNSTTQSYKELEKDLNAYLRRTNNNTTEGKRDKSQQLTSYKKTLITGMSKAGIRESAAGGLVANIMAEYFKCLNMPTFYRSFTNLAQFAIKRAERVKGCDSTQFFRDLAFLSQSECEYPIDVKLAEDFPVIRQVRGDGNCMYSALGFAFIECLLTYPDQTYIKFLLNELYEKKIKMQNIYEKTTDGSKKILIPGELVGPIFNDMLAQLYRYSDPNDQLNFYHLLQQFLVRINDQGGVYDILVAFMRSVAYHSLILNGKAYENFICEIQEVAERILLYEEEGDFLIINLICDVLPIRVGLIQWDQKQASQNIQVIQKSHSVIIGEVNLKYIPAHYDLVYRKTFYEKYQTFNLNFEMLEEGFCVICQEYFETGLLRLRRCNHCICYGNHTQYFKTVTRKMKCIEQSCSVYYDGKELERFLTLRSEEQQHKILEYNNLF